MSLRWYAEERRRTRTFDSPPVDHDFESFRIIFCALRDAEISASFLPPFALTHANYAPSGNRVPFLSPSLFFSKRADDRWECRRRCGKQRVSISVSEIRSKMHPRSYVPLVWKHRYRCKARFDSVVPARPIAITTIRVKFESERH